MSVLDDAQSAASSILDIIVSPSEMSQFFSFDITSNEIIYLGGYKIDGEESVTGTVSVYLSDSD